MLAIRESTAFAAWFGKLRDARARARIARRIDRLASGNPGDVKAIGGGLCELRIDYGPGYRVYFVYRGSSLVILLGGGDKRTQTRDIAAAKRLATELKEQ